MKRLFAMFMIPVGLTLLVACEGKIDPCESGMDLDFVEVKGEVRYDERFGRNIIIGIYTSPPVRTDGTDHYVPCSLSGEFVPGSKITFTGKGLRINPEFDTVVAGDAFYAINLYEVDLTDEEQ